MDKKFFVFLASIGMVAAISGCNPESEKPPETDKTVVADDTSDGGGDDTNGGDEVTNSGPIIHFAAVDLLHTDGDYWTSGSSISAKFTVDATDPEGDEITQIWFRRITEDGSSADTVLHNTLSETPTDGYIENKEFFQTGWKYLTDYPDVYFVDYTIYVKDDQNSLTTQDYRITLPGGADAGLEKSFVYSSAYEGDTTLGFPALDLAEITSLTIDENETIEVKYRISDSNTAGLSIIFYWDDVDNNWDDLYVDVLNPVTDGSEQTITIAVDELDIPAPYGNSDVYKARLYTYDDPEQGKGDGSNWWKYETISDDLFVTVLSSMP
jgi:hypothetical protein